MSKIPEKGKLRVWMNKKNGKLVEVFNGFLGAGFFFDSISGHEVFSHKTPCIFDDDERWRPDLYEDLGEL